MMRVLGLFPSASRHRTNLEKAQGTTRLHEDKRLIGLLLLDLFGEIKKNIKESGTTTFE